MQGSCRYPPHCLALLVIIHCSRVSLFVVLREKHGRNVFWSDFLLLIFPASFKIWGYFLTKPRNVLLKIHCCVSYTQRGEAGRNEPLFLKWKSTLRNLFQSSYVFSCDNVVYVFFK